MALVNEHFLKLPGKCFLSDVEKKINLFRITHPKANIIRLGSGAASLPLLPVSAEAMCKAIHEMPPTAASCDSIPPQGHDFLINAILKHDYAARGVCMEPDEIFIGKGFPHDAGNIGNLLRHDNNIGVTDPAAPFCIEPNAMCGRAGELQPDGKWSNVVYIPCLPENHFIPQIPSQRIDIVYLCHPNNPTGAAMGKSELRKWVNYALENDTLIIFDATYEPFIQNPDLPHSIYEIKGAKRTAIEFRRLPVSAGFADLQYGYTVIPNEVTAPTLEGKRIRLNPMWRQYKEIMGGQVPYAIQRGAEAVYTPEGKEQAGERIRRHMGNARAMRAMLENAGLHVSGGKEVPFLWAKAPGKLTAWEFFSRLLAEAHVAVLPGTVFGPGGEGYIRIWTPDSPEQCEEAAQRIRRCL